MTNMNPNTVIYALLILFVLMLMGIVGCESLDQKNQLKYVKSHQCLRRESVPGMGEWSPLRRTVVELPSWTVYDCIYPTIRLYVDDK